MLDETSATAIENFRVSHTYILRTVLVHNVLAQMTSADARQVVRDCLLLTAEMADNLDWVGFGAAPARDEPTRTFSASRGALAASELPYYSIL